MNRKKHTNRNGAKRQQRRGFLLTEVLIAAIVLVAVISVLTQLFVRGGRLQMDNRHYQVALDELTNQIDRLTALEEESRNQALEALTCSPTTQATLPSPKLTAEVLDDADGRRLVLSLAWNRFGAHKPVTLIGWLPPPGNVAANDSSEDSQL